MDQDKSKTKCVETASADATRTDAAIASVADAASPTFADRSDPAGEAASPAHKKRADAGQPKQAGKRKGAGETGTGSDQGNPKPPKNKAQSDGAATSKAKSNAKSNAAVAPVPSKLDQLVALLRAPGGATLPELQSAIGWQVHSVRGAMAGALRRKGYSVTSEKPEGGLRRYRIVEAS
jgi:hypothetical protein